MTSEKLKLGALTSPLQLWSRPTQDPEWIQVCHMKYNCISFKPCTTNKSDSTFFGKGLQQSPCFLFSRELFSPYAYACSVRENCERVLKISHWNTFYVTKNNLCIYFDANEKRHIKVTHISDILSVWGKQTNRLDKYILTGAIQFVLYIALALKKIASKFMWIKFVSNATYKEGLISPLKTDHLTGCCSRDPHNLLTHASSA